MNIYITVWLKRRNKHVPQTGSQYKQSLKVQAIVHTNLKIPSGHGGSTYRRLQPRAWKHQFLLPHPALFQRKGCTVSLINLILPHFDTSEQQQQLNQRNGKKLSGRNKSGVDENPVSSPPDDGKVST